LRSVLWQWELFAVRRRRDRRSGRQGLDGVMRAEMGAVQACVSDQLGGPVRTATERVFQLHTGAFGRKTEPLTSCRPGRHGWRLQNARLRRARNRPGSRGRPSIP
jgi:hypothetical protein